MDKKEKARLLRLFCEKFGCGETICLNTGDAIPVEDFITWVYERKDLDEQVISDRKKEFGLSLKPFYDKGDYPRIFLAEFFNYWTEPAKNGKRLRWELEKTWSLPGRLRRFAKNSKYKIKLPPSEMDFLDGGDGKLDSVINHKDLY